MSPTLLAHLQSIARQVRLDVAADNATIEEITGRRPSRLTTVRDFYRPLELVRRYEWNRL